MSTKDPTLLERPADRRSFLKWSGGAMLGAAALAQACKRPEDVAPQGDSAVTGFHIVLSGDDYGILNYAYALEQLEAAFYTKVAASPSYSTIFTQGERQLLTSVRDHEICHREFFKAALGSEAIPALTPDFSSIQFDNRASVLGAAKAFEDLGVSAYNGVGPGIRNPDYLVLAGKIVSVEARHAAFIRELIEENSFVDNDVVKQDYSNLNYAALSRMPISNNPPTAAEIRYLFTERTSVDRYKTPTQVIAAAQQYIVQTIDVSRLPIT